MGGERRAKVGTESTDPHAATHASERPPPPDPFAATHDSGGQTGPRAAAAKPDPFVGKRLAHFRIDAPLGQGGMGAVYRGWDTALERPVAIKVLTIDHPLARERFLREARAQAKVRHPHVVPIHYVGAQEGTVFLSMDLVEGPSIADRLESGPIAVDEALDLVDAVAQALAEGQRSGLVHRDVKPSNVLCAQDGRVLLADFGLAKTVGTAEEAPSGEAPASDAPAITHRGAVVGTPAYMAPEQSLGGSIDHRADMYALGVTLFEMLTGARPFEAANTAALLHAHREAPVPSPTTHVPKLPPGVDALVQRLMSKEPEARFGDYVTLRAAIDQARVREAPAVGGFTRTAAFLLDLVPAGLLAGLTSELHDALSWIPVILVWAALESRWGKTLGKRLFAMRVVERHERTPTFLRAVWRNTVKHWGALVASVLSGFLPDSQLQGAIGAVVLLIWLLGFALAFRKDKRALHDHLAGTRVAYHLS